MANPSTSSGRRFLITGGAGFIGCNYVHRLLTRGEQVTVYDNLSRRGTEANVAWLRERHGADSFRLVVGDVRDTDALAEAARCADVVVHLAGQTAVTTSVVDPRSDFEDNALGTFNALEAARHAGTNPIFLYASTNKVYGGMEEVAVVEAAVDVAQAGVQSAQGAVASARANLTRTQAGFYLKQMPSETLLAV